MSRWKEDWKSTLTSIGPVIEHVGLDEKRIERRFRGCRGRGARARVSMKRGLKVTPGPDHAVWKGGSLDEKRIESIASLTPLAWTFMGLDEKRIERICQITNPNFCYKRVSMKRGLKAKGPVKVRLVAHGVVSMKRGLKDIPGTWAVAYAHRRLDEKRIERRYTAWPDSFVAVPSLDEKRIERPTNLSTTINYGWTSRWKEDWKQKSCTASLILLHLRLDEKRIERRDVFLCFFVLRGSVSMKRGLKV